MQMVKGGGKESVKIIDSNILTLIATKAFNCLF